MKYIQFGSTELYVSRLCLGCMTYGEPSRGNHAWTLPEESSLPMLQQAYEAGINFLTQQIATLTAAVKKFLAKQSSNLCRATKLWWQPKSISL